MQGFEEVETKELADFFFNDTPMRILTAQAYFRVKHMQAWGANVRLRAHDTWDKLADRLEKRLEYHICHPWHWQEVAVKKNGGIIFRALE